MVTLDLHHVPRIASIGRGVIQVHDIREFLTVVIMYGMLIAVESDLCSDLYNPSVGAVNYVRNRQCCVLTML